MRTCRNLRKMGQLGAGGHDDDAVSSFIYNNFQTSLK
jgi:hypothetical protein